MYEKPELIEVGTAQKVVLGISVIGADPDTHDFPWPFEFADEFDADADTSVWD